MENNIKASRSWDAIIAAGVFLAAAAVFLFCLRPGVWYTDLGEFAVRPAFLSVGHYPGYPVLNQLYYLPHLIGFAPARLASALNAVFAAAAVAALFTAWRLLGARDRVAAPLALAFAFTPAYWNTATVGPDAYAFEILALASIIGLTLAANRRADFRYYLGAAFVWGLALANRTSAAFLALWLVPSFFMVPKRRGDLPLLLVALGFSAYLLLAFRMNSFADQAGGLETAPFKDCSRYVVGFSTHGGVPLALPQGRNPLRFLSANLIFQAKYGALALALMGLVSFFRRKGKAVVGVHLIVTGAAFLGLCVIYASGESEPYVLAPLAFAFTFAAVGAEAVWAALGRRRITAWVVALAVTAIPTYNFVRNFHPADRRRDRGVDTFVTESLRAAVYEAAVAGEHSNFMPFLYYRFARAARPDQTYYSVNLGRWRVNLEAVKRGEFARFAEHGSPAPRAAFPRKLYAVTFYPGIKKTEDYAPLNVEGAWLARGVAGVAEGGRFVAVVADATPSALRGRKVTGAWKTFLWRQPSAGFPLEEHAGTATFLAGVRRRGETTLFAAVRRGPARNLFACPADLTPGPKENITFAFAGDPTTGLTALSLNLGARRYALSTSGAVFVPLDASWRPTGEPRYFRGGRYGYTIFESLDRAWIKPRKRVEEMRRRRRAELKK